ncbi:MAG: hypothetical protein LBE37_03590 [Sphingobacterium sp.]|nr:hypothetical protein [Sphingobacterium sp.]
MQQKDSMTLELVKKFEHINPILTATTIDENTAIFLSYNEESMYYQLLLVSESTYKIIPLDYKEKYYSLENHPVLFSIDKHFGWIKNQNELLLYSYENQAFESIQIENSSILPKRFNLTWRVPISDSSVLPVCFNGDGINHDTRYLAFLDLDIINKQAHWESWTSLETAEFAYHQDNSYPPKIDTAMWKEDGLYVFTSGGQITSVNKWGMDYYAFAKGNRNGAIEKILFDSGNLQAVNSKKQGVNGLFSNSKEYLLLTPIFKNDQWKGKQHILNLESNEISEIAFPRGFGKFPQIVQHFENHFWVYLRDTKELAICKLKKTAH